MRNVKTLSASPLPLCHSLVFNLSIFASSFCRYTSHPRLGSIPHLLLSSDRKRQLPFGLVLILLANGLLLIQWLTRSPPIALNAPDNKESGFRSLAAPPPSRPCIVVIVKQRPRGPVQYLGVCLHVCNRALCLPARSALVRCLNGTGVPQLPPSPQQLLPLRSFSNVHCVCLVCLCVPRVHVGEHQART